MNFKKCQRSKNYAGLILRKKGVFYNELGHLISLKTKIFVERSTISVGFILRKKHAFSTINNSEILKNSKPKSEKVYL